MKGKKLGDIIAELRKEKGLTQKELADKLNTSDKSVSRWETNSNYPNIDMIYQISKFFKVSFYNLLEVRMQDDNEDDEVVDAIINEFHNMNKRNVKIIKFILISMLIILTLLIMTMMFTNSYNKFKVYQVQFENNDFYLGSGFYVETKIKDTLYINNLKFKNFEVDNNSTINVDLYYEKDGKEKIIQSYSTLETIVFSSFQEETDLSQYMDNLYLKITIIDSKGNVEEYNSKLKFEIDFSNNKIYNKDLNEIKERRTDVKENIEDILLSNGFIEIKDGFFQKKDKNNEINYVFSTNRINYNFEKGKLTYRIVINLNTNILEVNIYIESNIQVEEYKYDMENKKIIDCVIGKCNNYNEIIEMVNENVLYLFTS